MNTKEIESFNYFKAFACCFIILIHCKFPGYIGNVFRTIAKFGVPYFYMVAGYFFLYGTNCEYINEKTKGKIVHIIKIMIGAALFYFMFSLFYIFVLGQKLEVEKFVTIRNFLKLSVANSPFIYSHLWFLGALLYCYIFAGIIKTRICGKWKLYLMVVLLAMFTVMSEILPRFGLKLSFLGIALYNIFIFRALPFFLLGIYLRENKESIISHALKLKKVQLKCAISLGFALSLLERVLLVESQFYVGTYIAVTVLFIYCMIYPKGYNRTIQYIGKNLSMYIYILHVAIIKVCDLLPGGIAWKAVKPIAVIVISMVVSWVVEMVANWKKMKVYK